MVIVLLASCGWGGHDDVQEWHEATKEIIIEQSELVADSISQQEDPSSGSIERRYYYNRKLFRKEVVSPRGVVEYMVRYADDSDFAYCTEFCTHGYKTYEGIEYQHKPYGIATWYNCDNGKITEQGTRYKFRKTGVWQMYDGYGNPTREITYEKNVPLKSYPRIKE
ncbi:MAG TPA: hypothetical protein VIN07_12075 [Flavipsychrobacter sp.]